MNYEERDSYGMYAAAAATTDARHGPGPHMMGAGTLNGNDVCNEAGDGLGNIKEIMLDIRTGRIGYAVLSFGGFLGMGEKLFAVPWDALALDAVNKRFTLKVEQERLKSAPGFDKNHWPDMADPTWAKSIHSFYESTPSTTDPRV